MRKNKSFMFGMLLAFCALFTGCSYLYEYNPETGKTTPTPTAQSIMNGWQAVADATGIPLASIGWQIACGVFTLGGLFYGGKKKWEANNEKSFSQKVMDSIDYGKDALKVGVELGKDGKAFFDKVKEYQELAGIRTEVQARLA